MSSTLKRTSTFSGTIGGAIGGAKRFPDDHITKFPSNMSLGDLAKKDGVPKVDLPTTPKKEVVRPDTNGNIIFNAGDVTTEAAKKSSMSLKTKGLLALVGISIASMFTGSKGSGGGNTKDSDEGNGFKGFFDNIVRNMGFPEVLVNIFSYILMGLFIMFIVYFLYLLARNH